VAGASGGLVGADRAAVHVVDQPVQLPMGICPPVNLSQQPLEDPVANGRSDWRPSPRSCTPRQVPSGHAGGSQPHHRLHDLAVSLLGRPVAGRCGGSRDPRAARVGIGQLGFGSAATRFQPTNRQIDPAGRSPRLHSQRDRNSVKLSLAGKASGTSPPDAQPNSHRTRRREGDPPSDILAGAENRRHCNGGSPANRKDGTGHLMSIAW
jgi:hypothetical protein